MPALSQMENLSARATRAACGLVGIFLLLMQIFGPALASPGQSMWVEICSEAGAVWVEVDLDEEGRDPTAPCPKCADCVLCAATGEAPIPDLPQVTRIDFVQFVHCPGAGVFDLYTLDRLWPETRGPPQGPEIKTERALRASMALIQISGGAPWS